MDSTLYKKIENYIMDIIVQNASIPDFKLPSERALSIKFDASRKPVRRAYDNLIHKGYVVNIHGKGYFIGSNFKFRHQVVPGETLRLEVELTKMRGIMGKADVCAYVGDDVAAKGEISFALVDNK